MLFALFGKYDPQRVTEVHIRENQVFESHPKGIKVVSRYTEIGKKGGFIHIIKADSAEDLGALVLRFAGLVEFEITPVAETRGGRAAKIVEEYAGELISMYGPVEAPEIKKEI